VAKRTVQERFWPKVDKVDKAGADGCWLWIASTTAAGYGQLSVGTTMRYAHRLSYEWLIGPIPAGLDLDHTCRTRRCVNPDHLEPVTRSENNRRGLLSALRPEPMACPQGHVYDEANTYVNPKGSKVCRTCTRNRNREWAKAKRARSL